MADKLWEFVRKLNDRTNAGKVSWERTADEGVYQASFPNYTVRIFSRPSGDAEIEGQIDYVIQIMDQEATVVEEATDKDVARLAGISPREIFLFIGNLFKKSRRRAMGVDKALDAIMESLGPDPAPPGGDDVPF